MFSSAGATKNTASAVFYFFSNCEAYPKEQLNRESKRRLKPAIALFDQEIINQPSRTHSRSQQGQTRAA